MSVKGHRARLDSTSPIWYTLEEKGGSSVYLMALKANVATLRAEMIKLKSTDITFLYESMEDTP